MLVGDHAFPLLLMPADAPRWEPQLVEHVQEPAFHHWLVGERYAGGATREAILHPLRSLGELGQAPDEEGMQSQTRASEVKGYENTIIEMNPLKEAETAVDRFTRRWHVILYSKVKNTSKWLDQVEELIFQKEDLKAMVSYWGPRRILLQTFTWSAWSTWYTCTVGLIKLAWGKYRYD